MPREERPRPRRRAVTAVLALFAGLVVPAVARGVRTDQTAPTATSPAPSSSEAPASRRDPNAGSPDVVGSQGDRSKEILDYKCSNDLGLRQVTLFANGTVRVREGLGKRPRMRLGEIGPVELEGYLRRLRDEDLSEVPDRQESTEGSWVEHCTLRLDLDDRPERLIAFSRYDSLALSLSRVVAVADQMAKSTLEGSDLPVGYHARAGDVLRRADGVLFEVVGFTSDKRGVELQGVEQPLTVYVRPEDLPSLFEALVSRRRP